MKADAANVAAEVASLVTEYRARCLWFLRPDYMPVGPEETMRTLDLIERYGDRAAYQRTRQVRTWLLLGSKATS